MNNQLSNIKCINFTWDVSKLERFNSFNEKQPKNIEPILVIWDVLKLERINSSNDEQS